jgi:hypothetical protein
MKKGNRSRITKEEFFLFDGETYSQDQVDLMSYVGNCYIRYNSTIYDLTPLSKFGSYYFKTKEAGSIEFNICQNVISQCDKNIKGLAISKGKTCTQFAGRWTEDKDWSWENAGTDNVQVSLRFPPGEVCNKKTSEKYQVTMKLKCNREATVLKLLNDGTFDTASCNNTIIGETIEACEKTKFVSWWNSTPMNKYCLAGILFLVGAAFLILGGYFLKVSISIIVAVGGAIFIKALISPFFQLNIYMAIGLGVCLALLCYQLIVITPYVLGALLGFMGGSFAYTMLLVWFPTVNPQALYYSTLVVCIIIAIIVTYYVMEFINIIITSVIGAYLTVRAASIFLKGFPDETYTSALVEHYEFGQLQLLFGGRVIVYVIAMIALSIVGVIVQLGIDTASKEKKTE